MITSNAKDFRKIFRSMPIHPGAIVVEHLNRARTWASIETALTFIEQQPDPEGDMVNRIIEVTSAGLLFYPLAQDTD